jgi:NADPH:quinone reductase-like Zn-dependent oxidoreductase
MRGSGVRILFAHQKLVKSSTYVIPVVDREFTFDEALRAFEHMAEQRHFGKVVINVAGG